MSYALSEDTKTNVWNYECEHLPCVYGRRKNELGIHKNNFHHHHCKLRRAGGRCALLNDLYSTVDERLL